jgi:hypothetical protein
MGVNICKEPGGLVVVTGSGLFSFDDLQAIQNAAKETFESGGKARCLVTATGFTGWAQDGNWGDMAFLGESDRVISRIAVICRDEDRDGLSMFAGAKWRKAAVEFFSPGKEAEARVWLK